jgi:hypothetical protein
MNTSNHIAARLFKGRNRNTSNAACVVESLENRICMTASITVDPKLYSFDVSEHETIGFANQVGGPLLAEIHCQDIPQDPAQFQVSLAWGDGTVTKGGIAIQQTDEGSDAPFIWYATLGDVKTFGDPGQLPVTIYINQVGHPEVNATAYSTADIEEYPIRAHGVSASANVSPRDLKNVVVATFEDGFVLNNTPPSTDIKGSASNFAATIDWGDGTSSAGTIVNAMRTKGLYNVLGTHFYNGLTAHTYPVKVHIVETATGNDATALSTATVSPIPLAPINIVTAPLNPFSTTPVTKVWDL